MCTELDSLDSIHWRLYQHSHISFLSRLFLIYMMAGISAWTEGTSPDGSTRIGACIKGPPDSPFQEGLFALKIVLPPAYPMNPPQVRFETRVYHPNIDEQGRICLDTLKSAPSKAGSSGYWAPSLNLSTVLSTIQLLLANPNPGECGQG